MDNDSNVYFSDGATDYSSDADNRPCRPILCPESTDDFHKNEGYNKQLAFTDTDAPYAVATDCPNNSRWQTEDSSKYCGIYEMEVGNTQSRKCSDESESSGNSLLSRKREESKIRGRVAFYFIFISICIFVLLISSIVVLFMMLKTLQDDLDREKHERSKEANIFCLPCNDLILGPLEEDNTNLKFLNRKVMNGMEVCCAKGSNQTSILLDLRKEKLHKAQDVIHSQRSCKCNSTNSTNGYHEGFNRQTCHLVAGMQPTTNIGDAPFTVRNWIAVGPTAYSNGIHVEDSRVIISTSGLYFVYSQIFFSNLYKEQTKSNTSQALYHYVYRFNYIYPNGGYELLLKSVRTQCWAENMVYGDYTSYTAGVFKLNAGDQLLVKASKLDLISRDKQTSFFGVSKL